MGYLLLHPPAEGQSKVAICFLSEGWTHIAVSSIHATDQDQNGDDEDAVDVDEVPVVIRADCVHP